MGWLAGTGTNDYRGGSSYVLCIWPRQFKLNRCQSFLHFETNIFSKSELAMWMIYLFAWLCEIPVIQSQDLCDFTP